MVKKQIKSFRWIDLYSFSLSLFLLRLFFHPLLISLLPLPHPQIICIHPIFCHSSYLTYPYLKLTVSPFHLSVTGLLIRLTRLYIPCNQGYLEFMNHTLPNNTARSSSPPHPSAPSKTPPGSTSKICGKLEEISETEREFYFSPNLIEYAPQLIITGECVFSLTYHFVDHCYNTSITKFNDSIVLYTSNKVLQCNFYILQQYGYRINLTILVWSKNETKWVFPSFI